jgi:hypothetical protein
MALLASGSSAFAVGIDLRTYTCGGLNALIAARGFVYIASPFQGFAVAGGNFCSGSDRLEARIVATSDTSQCAYRTAKRVPTTTGDSAGRYLLLTAVSPVRPRPGEPTRSEVRPQPV